MMKQWRSGKGACGTPKLLLAVLFLANCALIPILDHHCILDGDFSFCFSSIQTEDDHHADCSHSDEGSALDCCGLYGDQQTDLTLKLSRSARDTDDAILAQGIVWFNPDRNPAPVVRETDRPVPRLSPLAHMLRAPPFRHTA